MEGEGKRRPPGDGGAEKCPRPVSDMIWAWREGPPPVALDDDDEPRPRLCLRSDWDWELGGCC